MTHKERHLRTSNLNRVLETEIFIAGLLTGGDKSVCESCKNGFEMFEVLFS